MKIKCPICKRKIPSGKLYDHYDQDHAFDDTIYPYSQLLIKIYEKIEYLEKSDDYGIYQCQCGCNVVKELKSLLENEK